MYSCKPRSLQCFTAFCSALLQASLWHCDQGQLVLAFLYQLSVRHFSRAQGKADMSCAQLFSCLATISLLAFKLWLLFPPRFRLHSISAIKGNSHPDTWFLVLLPYLHRPCSSQCLCGFWLSFASGFTMLSQYAATCSILSAMLSFHMSPPKPYLKFKQSLLFFMHYLNCRWSCRRERFSCFPLQHVSGQSNTCLLWLFPGKHSHHNIGLSRSKRGAHRPYTHRDVTLQVSAFCPLGMVISWIHILAAASTWFRACLQFTQRQHTVR